MKTLLRILIPILLIFPFDAFAQKEWSNWYLGGSTLVSFKNNNTPESITDFAPNATGTSIFDGTYGSMSHGVSYSDPLTGEMKFIVSEHLAFDRNYRVVPSQYALAACRFDKWAFHIIPFQSDPNKFYVVQYQDVQHDLTARVTGLQVRCPNAIGLGYSIFDLTLNNGLGNFTTMNQPLQSETAWGVNLIRHANGKDTWVVTHDYGNNLFKAFLFNDAGISSPVISAIGPTIPTDKAWVDGEFVVSHDGRTIFLSLPVSHAFYQLDFDNSTGIISNSRKYDSNQDIYWPLFSPDDSKLYFYGGYSNTGIFQMDFNETDIVGSITKIADDPNGSYYDMALGPDGKIYIGQYYEPDPNSFDFIRYLSVIKCPNLPKYASNFEKKGLWIRSAGHFPRFINDVVRQPKAPPVTNFSLGRDTAICFGSYKLTAPPGWEEYKWNTGETTREINVTKPGTYYVLAGSLGFSCPTAYGYIKIDDAATKLDLGRDTTLCAKQSVSLNIPSSYSNISWSNGGNEYTKDITQTGTYTVTALDASGCATGDTVSVAIKDWITASFGSDTVLCAGQKLFLELQPRNMGFNPPTYSWSTGSTLDTLWVGSPGTYWGEVKYQGCTVRDTIVVSYVDAAAFNLGADTTICTGETLELETNISNAIHEWSTGEKTGSIRVNTGGTYWVKVNNGSCTVTDTIRVKLQDKPVFDLGSDKNLCAGETALLELNIPGAKYRWQDSSMNNSFNVRAAGKYKVSVNLNGCVSADSVNVSYRGLPIAKLAADTSFCQQQSLRLDASDPSVQSYEWQDGTTASQITVTNAGVYTVKLLGTNGCINRDTIRVNATALPQFSLGSDTALCDRQVLRLRTSLANAGYRWSDGSAGPEMVVSRSGTYWLEVQQNGCSKRDSITVNFKPFPTVNLGRDTTLCEGVSKILNALYDGAKYTWQDLSVGASYEVKKAGVYHVSVDLNGCVARDTISITYKTRPQFSLGRDTAICIGEELVLRPLMNNASYRWQDGSGTASYPVREAGVYSLTATNECGSSSDEIVIAKGICKLYMPNAFTPNGDGLNDIFRVKDPGFIATIDLRVYNHFGELIFRTTDPRKGWDGTFKGQQQPNGNYAWQISITTADGEKDYKKGTVLLIR